MPSGRDSFRRNRVAPSVSIVPPASRPPGLAELRNPSWGESGSAVRSTKKSKTRCWFAFTGLAVGDDSQVDHKLRQIHQSTANTISAQPQRMASLTGSIATRISTGFMGIAASQQVPASVRRASLL